MALIDPGFHDHSSSDGDDIVERIARASIDINRFGLPQDARKRTEMQPTANDLIPAARRSMEMVRKSMEGKGPSPSLKPIIMEDEGTDEDEGSTPMPRKSLEEELGGDEEASLLKSFPKSTGLTSAEADRLFQEFGENTLPENITPPWLVLCRLLFLQPMPVIIWIAVIIEFAIINYIDGIILMIIVVGNASLSFYELQKAGNAVAALKQNMKPKAICKRDGQWNHEFPANLLVPGDLVELAAGNAVPADVMINDGNVEVDESNMTGETEPVSLSERTMAKMGGTIVRGECEATVVHTGGNTFFGKTAAMLGGETASNLQNLLQRLLFILVTAACLLSVISLIYLAATGHTVYQFLNFAVVLIVASVPLAMEIVTNTTLALGSRQLTAYGAIVSRLTSIEDLAGMNMLCSDKTGTLTKNKMEIQPNAPTFMPGLTQMDLLRYAAMAARWDSPPKDALDTLVLRCHLWVPGLFDAKEQHRKANPSMSLIELDEWANNQVETRLMEAMTDFERLDHMPFDPTVKRTESTIRIKSTGQIIKVTKGAPHIITALDSDEEKHAEVEEVVRGFGEDGVRCMAIAISDPLDGWDPEINASQAAVFHLAGILTFLDPPRLDTKDTIARAQRYGVPVKMITGDHLLIAKKTAKDLDMGDRTHPQWPNIQGPSQLPLLIEGKVPKNLLTEYGDLIRDADGFAQVYPEHKFLIVETYRGLGYKTGMTGDGVNDAPALKAADVGIAVAGATEAARAAADIVLTEEGLGTIVYAMEIARIIFRRMKAFITYRIAASLYILLTFFIALFAFRPPLFLPIPPPLAAHAAEWEDYFQLPVLFLIFITVFNDGCIIAIGYDRAVASQIPERWVLPALWIVAGSLAFVASLGTLIFIYCCIDSWNPNGLFQLWDIGGLQYGQIMTAVYLQTSIAAFLTLFSARTQSDPWFSTAPHPLLGAAAALALTLSNVIALAWGPDTLSEIPILGLAWYAPQLMILWTWLYTVFIFLLQDCVKLLAFKIIIYYNLFNFVHDNLVNPTLHVHKSDVQMIEITK